MSNQADLADAARKEVKNPDELVSHDGLAAATSHIVAAANQGEAAPVNDGAPGGAEQSEVAAAVAEARAEGEKQRVGDGDDDFDDVRAELDAAGEDPPVHLSAAKEKRLEKRGLKKPATKAEKEAERKEAASSYSNDL